MRRAAVASKSPPSRALKVINQLDAFPKVPDSYKQTSASGGGTSLITFLVILLLMVFEVRYYTSTQLKFDYVVDTEVDGKIPINIDMTVAMRCELIGADVLDLTGQDTQSFGALTMENTHFELEPRQRSYHEYRRSVNRYMRDEYHAIQELMWLSGLDPGLQMRKPASQKQPEGPPDACRVHGTLEVNKVAGNFHITAGKYFPVLAAGLGHVHIENFMTPEGCVSLLICLLCRSLYHPKGHMHITGMLEPSGFGDHCGPGFLQSDQGPYDYNFSHRIDLFSFGEQSGGIINPLDGEEQITKNNYHLFQYFMKIVPTDVKTYINQLNTYQFSVTEKNRSIDHSSGSHGMPGIFVKYDVFSFKIIVREEHQPYSQFLVRLCGIVGGIFVVSGLLHDGVGVIVDILCCRFKVGKYGRSSEHQTLLLPEASEDPPGSHRGVGLTDSFNPADLLQQPSMGGVGLVVTNGDHIHGQGPGGDR